MRFWGATDTFAPYALVGSAGLVFIGLALENGQNSRRAILYWSLAGAFAGLAHLTRADGLLVLFAAWAGRFIALRSGAGLKWAGFSGGARSSSSRLPMVW